MNIYIKWDNDTQEICLPINPAEVAIEGAMNNTSVTVHNLGEINLKGKRGLYSVAIESFFPSQTYEFEKASYRDPYEYYIPTITDIYENNTTVHLIITETDINGFYEIESWSHGPKEQGRDISYSIGFKEHRENTAASAGGSKRIIKAIKQNSVYSHKWRKGDTWQKVTKMYLGSSKSWKTQKTNNKKTINKAKKKHPKQKTAKALVGYKVVIKA